MLRIFGLRRDKVIECWWKLHNEELHNSHSSTNIIKTITSWRMRWAGNVVLMGYNKNACRVLVGKPDG
jgi:hypothetical protein